MQPNINMVPREALHLFMRTPNDYAKYCRDEKIEPMYHVTSSLTSTKKDAQEFGYHEMSVIKVALGICHFCIAGSIEELPASDFYKLFDGICCARTIRKALKVLSDEGVLSYRYDEHFKSYDFKLMGYDIWCPHTEKDKKENKKSVGYLTISDAMFNRMMHENSLTNLRFYIWITLNSDVAADNELKKLADNGGFEFLPSIRLAYTYSKIASILPYYMRNKFAIDRFLVSDKIKAVVSNVGRVLGKMIFEVSSENVSRLSSRREHYDIRLKLYTQLKDGCQTIPEEVISDRCIRECAGAVEEALYGFYGSELAGLVQEHNIFDLAEVNSLMGSWFDNLIKNRQSAKSKPESMIHLHFSALINSAVLNRYEAKYA